MAGQTPEELLYECRVCGWVWRTQSDEQRQACPWCDSAEIIEVEPVPEPPPTFFQRLFGRGSP